MNQDNNLTIGDMMKWLYLISASFIFMGGGMAMEKMLFHPAYIALWGVVIGLLIGMSIPEH